MSKKDLTNVQQFGKMPVVHFYVRDASSDNYWHGEMPVSPDRGQIAMWYEAALATIEVLQENGAFCFSIPVSAGQSFTPQHEVDGMPFVYTDAPPKPSVEDPVFEPGYKGWAVLVHEVLKTGDGGLDCISHATKPNGDRVYTFPIHKVRAWEVDQWLRENPHRTTTFEGPHVLTWRVSEGAYTYEDKEGKSHTRRYVNMVDLIPANEYTVKRNDPERLPTNNGNGSEKPFDLSAARAKYSYERVAEAQKAGVPPDRIIPPNDLNTREELLEAWNDLGAVIEHYKTKQPA